MIDRVTQHAKDVVSGKCPSGELHRLACERHLSDLKKQGTKDFPYKWNKAKAKRVIDFAETLTLIEGHEPKQLKLIPEQAFDIGSRFGWINKKGYRRFRRSYKCMARQNGKTLENGIIATYISAFSGYNYGKLFTVATKKKQARLAWEEASKFIKADPELGELFEIKDYISTIICKVTGCKLEALSKEGGLDEGFRSVFSSVDELHQHKDNQIYKNMYNGTKALPETLVSMITTRGSKLNSFCKEMDEYAIKVLMGLATADDFFVDIYTLDKGDDPWNEANWFKANPYLVTNPETMKTLRADAQTAKDMGGFEQRDFLIKSLNVWDLNGEDTFTNLESWHECASDKTLEDCKGYEAWVGLDLSSGGDLTTLHLELIDPSGDSKAYQYSHSFMPKGRLLEHIETDVAPYDLWEANELLTVTGGEGSYKNDYKFIISYLRDILDRYKLTPRAIGVDPHNADALLSDLESFGVPVMLVTQSARALNDATVDVQLSIKSKEIEYHKSQELLSWSVSNASLVHNSFGEVKVDKQSAGGRNKRIDPVDAFIDARFVRLKLSEKKSVDLDGAAEDYLAAMGWE